MKSKLDKTRLMIIGSRPSGIENTQSRIARFAPPGESTWNCATKGGTSMPRLSRRVLLGSAIALPFMSSIALAADRILASVPGLSFPFFVHMMNAFKAEIAKQGYEAVESDGQVSSPKQTADVEAAIAQGVKGIVIRPNDAAAGAP